MSIDDIKKQYEAAKKEAFDRITTCKYDSLKEAQKKASDIASTEDLLVSVWMKETDDKKVYYVVLSRDRELAYREGFTEVIKSYDL